MFGLFCRRRFRIPRLRHSQRKPIRPCPVPFLNQDSVRLTKVPQLRPLPSHNFLQNWHQCRQRIRSQHSSRRGLRHVPRIRNRNRESVPHVHVQHYMHVRASVAHIHNVIRSNLQTRLQSVQRRHLAISCCC